MQSKIREFYERNEIKISLGFFVAGIVFDIFTLAAIDDPLSILQQVVYLGIIGSFIVWEIRRQSTENPPVMTKFKDRLWEYREIIIHFLLGSLLSIYSLFFIKSASIFSSFIFLFVMAGLMVANELPVIQKSKINIKFGLWVLCVFSFFSMLFPVFLGFVGWIPFILASVSTGIVLWGLYEHLKQKLGWNEEVKKRFAYPGAVTLIMFIVFYVVGWIPPVPIAIQSMGIYHNVEKRGGQYQLSHENPWWKIWRTGDQDFIARPGDQVYFFAEVFSPSRFSDNVVIHWKYDHPKLGWQTSDKVPMSITGGREQGFRGYAVKKNFQEGDWRVQVETTDGREIGRIYLNIAKSEDQTPRQFQIDIK